MKVLYELSALTAEGLGGKEKYVKVVTAESEAELRALKRQFALEFGVDLQLVEANIVTK